MLENTKIIRKFLIYFFALITILCTTFSIMAVIFEWNIKLELVLILPFLFFAIILLYDGIGIDKTNKKC